MFVTSHLVIRYKRLLLNLSKFSVNSAVFECTQLVCVHVLMYSPVLHLLTANSH